MNISSFCRVGRQIATEVLQNGGANFEDVQSSTTRELYKSYRALNDSVLKTATARGYLISQAKEQRRNGRWAEASASFESAGEIYSAMYCLHMAIEKKKGNASDHFYKLSQLYRQVGRNERGERYFGYYQHAKYKENLEVARQFYRNYPQRPNLKKLAQDFGDAMTDDHNTFVKNLDKYVKNEAKILAQGGI